MGVISIFNPADATTALQHQTLTGPEGSRVALALGNQFATIAKFGFPQQLIVGILLVSSAAHVGAYFLLDQAARERVGASVLFSK